MLEPKIQLNLEKTDQESQGCQYHCKETKELVD